MSRWQRYASHLLRVQQILSRGLRGAIACRTAVTRLTICQYYKPGRPYDCGFWYLRSGPRLGPARSLRTAINVPHGVIRSGAFNPLRRFRLWICGGRSLLPPHFRWGVAFFFLFVIVGGGRRRSLIVGHHVRSAFGRFLGKSIFFNNGNSWSSGSGADC